MRCEAEVRVRRRAALTALTGIMILFGAGTQPAHAAPAQHARAVFGTSATTLLLDGKPWWPIGLNAYSLGTDWNVNVGCGPQVDLDAYFSRLPARSLTRVAVVSAMAVNKTTGELDFTALDAVFDAAARHDQLLIPVLASQDGQCENGDFKDYRWYAGGWRSDTPPAAPMPFAQWLDTAVRRWADSPAVAGWSPIGEPTPSVCQGGTCDWRTTTCPADAAAVLRAFYDATGARIRQLDPGAVVWDGRLGGDQCGSDDDDYRSVSTSPGIDVLEFHDYTGGGGLPGHEADGLPRRIDQARAVGKPLVVAEIGMPAGLSRSPDGRRDALAQIIGKQRAAGTAGALLWAFMPEPRRADCTLDVGPADPLLRLVGN